MQFVGVGTTSPATKLHVQKGVSNGSILSTSTIAAESNTTNWFHFINPEANDAGVISGTNLTTLRSGIIFDADSAIRLRAGGNTTRLYVGNQGNIGIGTLSPSAKLDVNGNINIDGTVQIDGNTGAAGQVLTSNGSSRPSWKSTAYNNSVRFLAEFTNTSNYYGKVQFTSKYNTNPTAITITPTQITINQSGLYHFEFFVRPGVTYSSYPSQEPAFDLQMDGFLYGLNYFILADQTMPRGYVGYSTNASLSMDIYIAAPAVFGLDYSFSLPPGPVTSYNI